MRRCILALAVLALAGCKTDVHIHVYDDDGDDTDDALDTDSGFADSGNSDSAPSASDSNPSASDSDASASDSNASASDSDSDPTSSSDSNASDSDTTGDDSSTSGSTGGNDNTYPQPSNGACPEGFGYNADGDFEFCGPVCGEGDTCPDTVTGNVLTMCVFNPDSSMSGCMSGLCADTDESCFAGACMLPATHCAPLCSTADAVCPVGMECTNNDVCRFPI